MRTVRALTSVALCALTVGCGDKAKTSKTGGFTLTSPAFTDGGKIPAQFTCSGGDTAPPLRWTTPPEGTQSLAVIMTDLDAGFGHWAVYGIQGKVRGLPPPSARDSGAQAKNDFGKTGYRGPCPPPGPEHRYEFEVIASKSSVAFAAQPTVKEVRNAIEPTALATAKLVGTFSR